MAQPSFWLKVNKNYVIENFENLLEYVRDYDYNIDRRDENKDFDDTCRALAEVADDFSAVLDECSLYDTPEFSIPPEKVVRILATNVLVVKKRGLECHKGILDLIRILLAVHKQITPASVAKFLPLAIACISEAEITKFKFNFQTLKEENFMFGPFTELLTGTETKLSDKAAQTLRTLTDRGTVALRDGKIVLGAFDNDELKKGKLKKILEYGNNLEMRNRESERLDDVTELTDFYPALHAALDRIEQPAEKKLKTYHTGKKMMVKLVHHSYLNNTVRTIDPEYKRLQGKLLVDEEIYRCPRDYFLTNLKEGYYLWVELTDNPLYPFKLDYETLNEFVEAYTRHFQGDTLPSIYYEQFSTGTGNRWLSNVGLFLNVVGLPPKEAREAIDSDNPIPIRLESYNTDKFGSTVANGSYRFETEWEIPGDFNAQAFEREAMNLFFEEFIGYMQPETEPEFEKTVPEKPLSKDQVTLLARILRRIADSANLTTPEKLSLLTMSLTAASVGGDERDIRYIRHQLDYMAQIVKFARGESPMSLSLKAPDGLDKDPDAAARNKIVGELWRYKESETTVSTGQHALGIRQMGRTNLPTLVHELINASNILYDKIDSSEINRIKKSIADKLGVADVYKDINSDLPYFGVENETLEFKGSCAMPPVNRRTNIDENDIEIQKWNILKAVCAFLNSQRGGELIIGVTDSGYASGLAQDIDLLHRKRIIYERTADRLRTYIKNEIDRAFVTSDGKAKGTDITTGYVHCEVDKPKENIEVIRIKIDPYPWDVVKIGLDKRPEGFKATYCRTSGASTPLSKEGIRDLRLKKIQNLDKDNLKLAKMYEAMDTKKVVVLRNYTSRNGKKDRTVEPHTIMPRRNAMLAYDRVAKGMRIFKFSRFDDWEVKTEKWKYESQHRDADVDIFGMMQQPGEQKLTVSLLMSEYALCLLKEEFSYGTDDGVRVNTYDGPERREYPWRVDIDTYGAAGIERFVRGLPDDVRRI